MVFKNNLSLINTAMGQRLFPSSLVISDCSECCLLSRA